MVRRRAPGQDHRRLHGLGPARARVPRPRLHIASHTAVVQAADDSRRQIQATDGAWYADYPSASDFFDPFFRCSAFRLADPAATRNGSFYCTPQRTG